MQETKLRNLVGAGNSKIKVLGMAQVATAINGVGGMVNYAVVEELPAVLPEVIIGRNALVENPWRVMVDKDGTSLSAKEGAITSDEVEMAVVSVMDELGREEIVYDAPAYEDVVHEEDGEEVDYMPPREKEQREVLQEIAEFMKKMDHLGEGVQRDLKAILERRWRAFANKLGGVTVEQFEIKTEDASPSPS